MEHDLRSELGAIDLTQQFADLVKFRVPTGIIAFDKIFNGGIPAGKLTELYGDFNSGKSRIACHVLASTQKLGGDTLLIDTERSLDTGLVTLTGLDVSKLIYPNPDGIVTLEDVFTLMEKAVKRLREENPDGLLTIVWDSVATAPGIAELESAIGQPVGALRRAKLISDGLKRVMADVYRSKICLIFINQIRDRIDVQYGDKTETVGGKALKYTAALRVHVKLVGKIKDEVTKEQKGLKGQVVVERSKVGRPFGMVNFDMMADTPIDTYTGLLDYMVRHGEVEQSGAWYSFKGQSKKFHSHNFEEEYEKFIGGTLDNKD